MDSTTPFPFSNNPFIKKDPDDNSDKSLVALNNENTALKSSSDVQTEIIYNKKNNTPPPTISYELLRSRQCPTVQKILRTLESSPKTSDQTLYKKIKNLPPTKVALTLEAHGKKEAAIEIYRAIVAWYQRNGCLIVDQALPLKAPFRAALRLAHLLMPEENCKRIKPYEEAITYLQLAAAIPATTSPQLNELIGEAHYMLGRMSIYLSYFVNNTDSHPITKLSSEKAFEQAVQLGYKKAYYEHAHRIRDKENNVWEKIACFEAFIGAFPQVDDQAMGIKRADAHMQLGKLYDSQKNNNYTNIDGIYTRPRKDYQSKVNEHGSWKNYDSQEVQDALNQLKNSSHQNDRDLYKTLLNMKPLDIARALVKAGKKTEAIPIYEKIRGTQEDVSDLLNQCLPFIATLELGYLRMPESPKNNGHYYKKAAADFCWGNAIPHPPIEAHAYLGEACFMMAKIMNMPGISYGNIGLNNDQASPAYFATKAIQKYRYIQAHYFFAEISLGQASSNATHIITHLEDFIAATSTSKEWGCIRDRAHAHYWLGELYSHAPSVLETGAMSHIKQDLNQAKAHYNIARMSLAYKTYSADRETKERMKQYEEAYEKVNKSN